MGDFSEMDLFESVSPACSLASPFIKAAGIEQSGQACDAFNDPVAFLDPLLQLWDDYFNSIDV